MRIDSKIYCNGNESRNVQIGEIVVKLRVNNARIIAYIVGDLIRRLSLFNV